MTIICSRTNEDGDEFWYNNGKLHRTDSPAVEWADGSKLWYKNGKLHRTDGPAVYANDHMRWCKNGKLHRTDGPAIIWANGNNCWYISGNRLTPAEFAAKVLDKETALLWKMSGYTWPFNFGGNK